MRRLDDPALLAQCRRIRNLWEEIANDPAHADDHYAKHHHHWQMGPTVAPDAVERWEAENRLELPDEYVYYITQVGNGGACPGDRLCEFPPQPAPLPDIFRNDPPEVQKRVLANNERKFQAYLDSMRRPSEQLSRFMSEEEWETACGSHKMREDGTLDLCAADMTFIAYLIVTGEQRGRIVYLDWDGGCAPRWAKGCANFLDWMEHFYHDLSMGWTREGWQFMWQEPGDVDALIAAFRREEGNAAYQEEVLQSFGKFQSLPKKGVRFLQGVRQPQFVPIAQKLLDYFGKAGL